MPTDLGLREIGDDEENKPNEAEQEREEENEPDRAIGVWESEVSEASRMYCTVSNPLYVMPRHILVDPTVVRLRQAATKARQEEEAQEDASVRADAAGALALVAAGLLAGAAAPAAPGEREPREDHHDRRHQEQDQTHDRKPFQPIH